VKIGEGGWLPLLVAAAVFAMMTTWKKGRASLGRHIIANTLPLDLFLADVRATKPPACGHRGLHDLQPRRRPAGAPAPFQAQQGAPQQVVLLSVQTEHVPEVPEPSASPSRHGRRLLAGDGPLRLHADPQRAAT
jgi:KUP system potassium uptake protein